MLSADGGVLYSNESVRKHMQFDKSPDEVIMTGVMPEISIKNIMETTTIEEVTAGRDKKELTVYDFAMSYSQGATFELKAVKPHRPSDVSPSQV